MSKKLLLILSFSFLLISSLQALQVWPEVGDRIRVFIDAPDTSPVIGNVSGLMDSSIVLVTEDSVFSVKLNSINRMDISAGQKRYTVLGSLIGVAAGGIITGIAASKKIKVRKTPNNKDHDSCQEEDSDYNTGWPGNCDFFPRPESF